MQNEIIVNVSSGETRVALIERSQFAELHIERAVSKGVAGNVVMGRVARVLPGMQAAFVDIGLEKAGFLYVGDYFAEPAPGGRVEDNRSRRGRRGNNRQPPPIDTVLSEGQEIIVQIAKEPIGTKGARITSHVSIAGRHLVLTPWSPRVGVSRRIDADRERRRLREIVERHRPKDLGFIIRTAGDGLEEADLEADIKYLTTVWDEIQQKTEDARAPAVLYTEPDLPQRVLRDFATHETKRIVIDDDATYESLRVFADRFLSSPPKIEHYRGQAPIFDSFELESQIHANLERKVRLKSGGSLVIDQSEALTAIDVNSGRYVGKRDLEETVFRTNLEAVKEVVNQLRFRNIGGLIIIDLIDMESRENRDKVYRSLQEAIRGDKAKTNILKISELGLVEMTRKRTRENLVQAICEPCPNCEGRGYLLSSESVAFKVLREIRMDLPRFCGREIAVTVAPQVATQLLGPERKALQALSADLGRDIEVRSRAGVHQEQFEITALDQGPPVEIALRWLDELKPDEDGDEDEPSALAVIAEDEARKAAEAERVAPPSPASALASLAAAEGFSALDFDDDLDEELEPASPREPAISASLVPDEPPTAESENEDVGELDAQPELEPVAALETQSEPGPVSEPGAVSEPDAASEPETPSDLEAVSAAEPDAESDLEAVSSEPELTRAPQRAATELAAATALAPNDDEEA